jgi:UDP-2,3-diacylglucosamine pyrophosphatase LpxH
MAAKLKIGNKYIYQKLDALFEKSKAEELTDQSKWVIFSDLHMGDGGSTDDFKPNSDLFLTTLEEHYLKKKFGVILNGDVEELQRFSLQKIQAYWKRAYGLFDEFAAKTRFIKTIGNHDLQLSLKDGKGAQPYDLREAIKLKYGKDHLFIFHGHQASKRFQKHNDLIGFTLKYFADPLGIRNYSVSHSSRKQYKLERRLYAYSAYRKVVSIVGHTHRPLFESMHKVERLKFKIEQLCRAYALDEPSEEIKKTIKSYRKELKQYFKEHKEHNFSNYVYDTLFHIPCLFNSGCVVGKRGITCLEIEKGKIRLVHWFDKTISKKYLRNSGYKPRQLGESPYYRMVINEEPLNYIFTRIRFLA